MSVLPSEGIRFHVLIHLCNCTCNVEFNSSFFQPFSVFLVECHNLGFYTVSSVSCLNHNAPYPQSARGEPIYGVSRFIFYLQFMVQVIFHLQVLILETCLQDLFLCFKGRFAPFGTLFMCIKFCLGSPFFFKDILLPVSTSYTWGLLLLFLQTSK